MGKLDIGGILPKSPISGGGGGARAILVEFYPKLLFRREEGVGGARQNFLGNQPRAFRATGVQTFRSLQIHFFGVWWEGRRCGGARPGEEDVEARKNYNTRSGCTMVRPTHTSSRTHVTIDV